MKISERINIGVADITYTPVGSTIPIYLGLTKDGTMFEYDPQYYEITADQYGKTPLDYILTGELAKASTNILDTSKQNIANVSPTATAEMSEGNVQALTFGRRAGLRLSQVAGRLTIHPISAGVGHVDNDVIIYQAANTAKLNLAFKLEEEWVIPCTWSAIPDFDRPEGDQLFRIGQIVDYAIPQKRVVSFYITPLQPSLGIGATIQFRANAIYEDFTTEDVTDKCVWTSSDSTIATITQPTVGSGTAAVATGMAVGTCVIRANYIGYSNTTALEVK